LDNKAKTQPTIRKPTLAGCYSIQKGHRGLKEASTVWDGHS
jgi:hypothetical protein